MSKDKTKIVTSSEKVKATAGYLGDALKSLQLAANTAAEVEGCPESIVNRLNSLKTTILKTSVNVQKRLSNLGAKVARVEAAKERKAKKLTKLLARQKDLEAKITDLQK